MNFEQLPDLTLFKVFSFFNLAEKSQLKRVCKRWQFLLQTSELGRTLVVYGPKMGLSAKWLDFVKSIDPGHLCRVIFDIKTERFMAGNQLLQNRLSDRIKKFYAVGLVQTMLIFSELVHLKQLEVLKIENCTHYDDLDEDLVIDFPNLCFLSIKNSFLDYAIMPHTVLNRCFNSASSSVCRIRAPNLVHCAIPNFSEDARVQLQCFQQLENFQELRYIRCDYFDANVAKKVPNLETLICKRLELPFRLDELPKLKEIALFPFVQLAKFEVAGVGRHVFNVETALQSLLEQKRRLSRFDLKILVNGFDESTEFFDLNEESWFFFGRITAEGFHNCFTDSNANLIAQNYDKLVRSLPFRTRVNYTNVTRVFNSQIPANFFEKFPEIASVSISEHVDRASDLFDFLEQCRNLQCLELKNCRYDQQFFLHLPRFQSLWHLTIEEHTGQIDFRFILQFGRLETFELHSDGMPIKLANMFVKEARSSFVFKKLNSDIEIKVINEGDTVLLKSLFIDGKNVSNKAAHYDAMHDRIDQYFSYLKKHEYGKFLV